MASDLTGKVDGTADGVSAGDLETGVVSHAQPQAGAVQSTPEEALHALLRRIDASEEPDPQGALAHLNAQVTASHGVDLGGLLKGLLGEAGGGTKTPAKSRGGASADLAPALGRIAQALGVSPAVVEQLAPVLGGLPGGSHAQKSAAGSTPRKPAAKAAPKSAASAGARRKSTPKAGAASKPAKKSSGATGSAAKKSHAVGSTAKKPRPAKRTNASDTSADAGGASEPKRKSKSDGSPWSVG